jgi:hypothetical protein
LVASGLLWSSIVRKRLGFERVDGRPVAPLEANHANLPPAAPEPAGKGENLGVETDPAERPEPHSTVPVVKPTEKALSKAGEPETPATDSHSPVAQRPQHDPPILLAVTLPGVTKSLFGPRDPRRDELGLPTEVGDHFEVLNAPEFQLVPGDATSTWDIATRTASGISGRFTLAHLTRTDARTWSFQWTQEARNHATTVEALRDAVLKFQTHEGRSIFTLLRGVNLDDPAPLTVWPNQPVLYAALDIREKSIPWTQHPEVLEGTRWKLSIRRWRLVITRTETQDRGPARRVIESAPAVVGKKDETRSVPMEQDLIPGEVTLGVAIDPTNPEMIAVRVNPDRNRVITGREERAARLKTLKSDTPLDTLGREQDPLQFRRGRLRELQQAEKQHKDVITTLKKEISDLKAIDGHAQIEDLLTNKARTELSAVIGLDIGGATIIDLARIGTFAGPR